MANRADIDLSSTRESSARCEQLYVVGIGASAGGLDALRELFREMPPQPGIACVVVVHLSPEHDSHLAELLQPYTAMTVQQVNQTVALERNRVYVIPPNANLDSIDTHLRLSELEERRIERAPIDHFFQTLASTHHGEAIGVVLTGAGSDGALGLRQIKEKGGLTIAQDPNEALFDSMPRSAIATGSVDVIAPLGGIPNAIMLYCRTEPRVRTVGGDEALNAADRMLLKQILAELRRVTNHDFRLYQTSVVLQRIVRRMRLCHVETLERYLELLRARQDEPRALANDLLLNVSEFFCESDLYSRLEQQVLPQLFDRKPDSRDRLRAWSIGCSTGEEAYSLAMLLLELADKRETRPQLQVFASDLSETALHGARVALYPREIAATISPKRLERFFQLEIGRYRVRREVRDIVVFATQNLFKDPPYSHLDLIVCRNLLRDLRPDVRRGVLSLFHYALEPHGVLIVGAEDKIEETDLFFCQEDGLYVCQRKFGPRRLELPKSMEPFRLHGGGRTASPSRDFATLHRNAMERYSPPSVLVDTYGQIVHYSAHAGRYVRFPGGEPTRDLLQMVSPPLRAELRVALQAARRDGLPRVSAPVNVQTGSAVQQVVVRVDPVLGSEDEVLVVFDDRSQLPSQDANGHTDSGNAREQTRTHFSDVQPQSAETGEPPSAGQERAEQLQAVTEELQNAREHLDALNEELRTLDDENRRRLNELAEVSGDLQRLLESTGVATLFVDLDLRIRRFTPQIASLFNVRHTDIGRPLSDLTHRLRYVDLESDVRYILEHRAPLDREVPADDGSWYLMRMLPYRPSPDRVDGVVITFVDISVRKQAEEKLLEADRRKDEFLAVLAHELRNPLAPISAGVEVLKTAKPDQRVIGQVAAILDRQTQQLARLVDDLLEVSRISGGKLHLRKSVVQLADIVNDAVATAKPLIERLGHQLDIVLPDAPIMLEADGARLTQVLANLFNNAARYSLRDGRIELRAERRDDVAVIKVKDSGIGIAKHALPRVFELFYQDQDPRFERNSGLGIGLTLAKSLVEMHGGTIEVESPGIDRGSVFTLRLPIAVTAVATPGHEPRPPRATKRRVLIVDDNNDAAETLCMLVESLGGNQVRTASSGEQALETARELRPDVVLLDLGMPGMDGYEVARRMRQEPWGRDATIIAVTGWGQEEHRRRTKEAGFDRHLTKPADVEAIESLLAEPPARLPAQSPTAS